MQERLTFKGIRVVDPACARDEVTDFSILNGHIAESPHTREPEENVLDGREWVVVPGLVDVHVHLRDPGDPEAETVQTGCKAAAAGGFGTVVAMPNTRPPCDSPARVLDTIAKARVANGVIVLPSACLTQGRAGQEPADLRALAEAGAVAFTDDGSTVPDERVMEQVMAVAAGLGLPVMDHALDPVLAGPGVIRAGPRALELGWPGIPPEAEVRVVERDIHLCARTGCHVHIQHISAAGSIEAIRQARARGLPVTGEASPHHLVLADEDIPGDNPNFKMNPPLGSRADAEALRDAVADGTLSVLATDHAPHTSERKAAGFLKAPFGIIGLETAVGLTYTCLVESGRMSLLDWVARWTTGPADLLNLPPPTLTSGHPATLTVLDLKSAWTIDPSQMHSKSRNTPFTGRTVRGRAILTMVNGRMTWSASGRWG
jgi:dihydroorotase